MVLREDLSECGGGLYSWFKSSTWWRCQLPSNRFKHPIHPQSTLYVALLMGLRVQGRAPWPGPGYMTVFPGTAPPRARWAHCRVHRWNASAQTRDGVGTRQPTSPALLSVQLLLYCITFKMKWESPCCKPLIRTISAFDRSPTWDNWSWSVNN